MRFSNGLAEDNECPFCFEMLCFADAKYHWPDHWGQYVMECENCHRKFDLFPDYSFEDGGWRNCSTFRPLKAIEGVKDKLQ